MTGKRRHQLAELRKLRGYSQGTLGRELGLSGEAVARWERGMTDLRPDKRRALARVLQVSVERLDRILANQDTGEDKDHLDATGASGLFQTLEQSARTLLTWETVAVPGLLQTEAYARVLLKSDEDVRARLRRQQVLTRGNSPLQLRAVLYEPVLDRPLGSVGTLRGQLEHLALMMAEYDNVDVRIMPLKSEHPLPVFGGIVIFQASWGGTVFTEHAEGGQYLAEPAQVANHEAVFARLWQLVQPPRESLATVRKRAAEL